MLLLSYPFWVNGSRTVDPGHRNLLLARLPQTCSASTTTECLANLPAREIRRYPLVRLSGPLGLKLVKILSRTLSLTALAFSLLLPCTQLVADSGFQDSGNPSTTAGSKKSSAHSAPSAEEIAAAKSKGLVWVNLSTHVYHKGGPLYGNTKRGKFMTEGDAKKAGYRQAKENESSGTSPSSNP